MNTLFLQTAIPNLINSESINQVQSLVNAMASDAFPKAFAYLCLIIIIIFLFLTLTAKLFEKLLSKTEYIKLGFLTFKNKNHINDETKINNHEVDINIFIKILDVIMTAELEKFSSEIITATKDIRKIEDTYDDQAHNIFNKILNSVKTEYHDRLLVVAMNTTGFDLIKIKNSREYFFILDLLRDFEIDWLKCSKEITRRNGFIEFLNDKNKSKDYIEELQECIFQCIDSRKLDMTEIKRDELEESLKTVNVEMYSSLEKMFTNLANLKKLMLLKREAKLKYIDDTVKNSATNIIMMIKTRVLSNMFDTTLQLQHRETSENDNTDL